MTPEQQQTANEQIDLLSNQINACCVGNDLGLVFCALLNMMGGTLEHMHGANVSAEALESSEALVRGLPERVRERLATIAGKAH